MYLMFFIMFYITKQLQMGSQQSKQIVDNPTLGRVQIVKLQFSSKKSIEFSYLFAKTSQLQSFLKLIKNAKKINLRQSLLSHHYELNYPQCGQEIIIKLYFPYFDMNVQMLMEKRKHLNAVFTESQIIVILGKLLTISSNGQENRQTMINVGLQNIVFQSGKLHNCKIITKYTKPLDEEKYEYFKPKRLNIGKYCSPEKMVNIALGYDNSSLDKHKSQIFSIGMMILSLCLMKDMEQCYDFDNPQSEILKQKTQRQETLIEKEQKNGLIQNTNFNFQKFEQNLANLQLIRRFSPTLKNIIKQMLITNYQKRPNATELLIKLQKQGYYLQLGFQNELQIHKLGNHVKKRIERQHRKKGEKKAFSGQIQNLFGCDCQIMNLQMVESQYMDESRLKIYQQGKSFNI